MALVTTIAGATAGANLLVIPPRHDAAAAGPPQLGGRRATAGIVERRGLSDTRHHAGRGPASAALVPLGACRQGQAAAVATSAATSRSRSSVGSVSPFRQAMAMPIAGSGGVNLR